MFSFSIQSARSANSFGLKSDLLKSPKKSRARTVNVVVTEYIELQLLLRRFLVPEIWPFFCIFSVEYQYSFRRISVFFGEISVEY